MIALDRIRLIDLLGFLFTSLFTSLEVRILDTTDSLAVLLLTGSREVFESAPLRQELR